MIDELRLFQAVGRKIRQLRESQTGGRARLTQSELAKMVGLERTSITNIERGNQKVPLHVLYRLCEALKVPIGDVMPQMAHVQSAATTAAPLEEFSFASETVETTPLVKQAVLEVLNRSS
ncbi:HTH-type transcriptional repressor RghR [mine drainage metagenome]|uniref:HTH-type transcriptional repressor RghR n=1 Tax=mine drainage metagenome TaxID=410659 RepID=A0A1J5RNE7_9ZZZZ